MRGWVSGPSFQYDYDSAFGLDSGESNFPRQDIETVIAASNQEITGAVFNAAKAEDINTIEVTLWDTQFSGAPTLARVGVYEWNMDTDVGTLVASSANDTTLFQTSFTTYSIPLSTTWKKKRGKYYVIPILTVASGVGGPPRFLARTAYPAGSVAGDVMAKKPRMIVRDSGHTDLPATLTSSALGGTGRAIYVAMIP